MTVLCFQEGKENAVQEDPEEEDESSSNEEEDGQESEEHSEESESGGTDDEDADGKEGEHAGSKDGVKPLLGPTSALFEFDSDDEEIDPDREKEAILFNRIQKGPVNDVYPCRLEDGTEGFKCRFCPDARLTSSGDIANHLPGKKHKKNFKLWKQSMRTPAMIASLKARQERKRKRREEEVKKEGINSTSTSSNEEKKGKGKQGKSGEKNGGPEGRTKKNSNKRKRKLRAKRRKMEEQAKANKSK
jgi:hypothetical protein